MSLRAIAYPESVLSAKSTLATSEAAVSARVDAAAADGPAPMLLVVLHGWGANAQDVAAMAPYLLPTTAPSALYQVFPDAPFRHAMPGGRMWYDLSADYRFDRALTSSEPEDLLSSRALLLEWLQSLETQTGVPLSRTILAGFSQGGAMTVDVGTRLPLAGLMILSGYLHTDLSDRPTPTCPILQVHGRHDPVVPLSAAYQVRDRLRKQGAAVQYHELDMGHDIPLTVLELMQIFIQEILSA